MKLTPMTSTAIVVTNGLIIRNNLTYDHSYIEYNTVIIKLLYKVCKSKDIDDNAMKSFTIDTNIDILVGKINHKMFACKNSCPHRAALLSKGQLKPSDNRIACYMHGFEYNVFTGKLERIPNKWINQSQGWKKSGELILYDVIEREDGSVFVDIAEEPINA